MLTKGQQPRSIKEPVLPPAASSAVLTFGMFATDAISGDGGASSTSPEVMLPGNVHLIRPTFAADLFTLSPSLPSHKTGTQTHLLGPPGTKVVRWLLPPCLRDTEDIVVTVPRGQLNRIRDSVSRVRVTFPAAE